MGKLKLSLSSSTVKESKYTCNIKSWIESHNTGEITISAWIESLNTGEITISAWIESLNTGEITISA